MIKQIIPAHNWVAVTFRRDPPYYFLDPIACWVLEVSDDGENMVKGYVGGDFLNSPEDSANFYIYTATSDIQGEDIEHWSLEGKKWAEKWAEKHAKI